MDVKRRRFAILATLLVAVNVFFWLAQSGFALPAGGVFQTIFGGHFIRAEVIWANGKKIEDTRVDRGVITSVTTTTTTSSVVLHERDGTTQTIALAPTVRVSGLATLLSQLRTGMRIVVSGPAAAQADTVLVEGYGP